MTLFMIISLYIIIMALMLADEATTVNKEDALFRSELHVFV